MTINRNVHYITKRAIHTKFTLQLRIFFYQDITSTDSFAAQKYKMLSCAQETVCLTLF